MKLYRENFRNLPGAIQGHHGPLVIIPSKMKVFRGKLESACLSIHLSVCQSLCVQNTTVCQSAAGDIKSHLVTALVLIGYTLYFVNLFDPISMGECNTILSAYMKYRH